MGFTKKTNKYLFSAFFVSMALSLSACNSSNNSNNSTDEPVVIAALSVTSTAPADSATGIGTNSKVVAVFNKDVAGASVSQTSFTLQGAGETAVVGDVFYNELTKTATFTPTPGTGLSQSTLYTATLTTDIEDQAGDSLVEDVVWTFTTGAGLDNVAPTLTAITPADGVSGVLLNTKLNLVFSEAIDPATVTKATVALSDTVATVDGTLSYVNPTTVVFSPSEALAPNMLHTVVLSSSIADLAGNFLAGGTFTFTTGENVSSSPQPVELGTAGNYVLLAKTAISTTGTTKIVGDVAVSPQVRAALTGFADTLSADGTFATSALVTGKLFAANMAAPTPATLTTAIENMGTAYTDAADRAPDFTELGAGEIGGMTLDTGVYKWGTGVLVSSDVTLNGRDTDVWIFQIDGGLILQDGKSIILTGGALPENVFWQVADDVRLLAGTTFNGIILGKKRVDMKSGAEFNGRALVQTAISLIANDVNQPAK